ncbi:hypothetical protein [Mycobacterium avium]|uniref:hypothetical protein n=1 Tax=Mycobacterium avium TaxID=1764 RepID=UPI0010247472|nr:hypothetical protein [Mycobacterium avium]QBC87355.1 hypothetical protein B6K05_023285 [Mycobacterium avium subsp. hominissuis]
MKAALFNAIAAVAISALYLTAWLSHEGGINAVLSASWLGVSALWFSTAHYRLKEQKARKGGGSDA